MDGIRMEKLTIFGRRTINLTYFKIYVMFLKLTKQMHLLQEKHLKNLFVESIDEAPWPSTIPGVYPENRDLWVMVSFNFFHDLVKDISGLNVNFDEYSKMVKSGFHRRLNVLPYSSFYSRIVNGLKGI